MAGGLTENAYLQGARLSRRLTEEEKVREQATIAAIHDILMERDSIVWSKMDIGSSYYVGIDLEGALKKPGSDKDIILREGDQIFVPEYNGVVKISGNVMFPNTVFFKGGQRCNKYVAEAGGYGNHAKKSKTFIVYQNGTVGLVSQGAQPEPGCEIVVPTKKKREHTFNVATFAASMTSVATLATVVVSLVTLLKK
jgi:protein involved in polysaccharide export with SLBB domain